MPETKSFASRAWRYLAAILAGVIVGALLIYFVLVGAPRSERPPGQPVRPPDAGGPPAGTATLTLDEQFFNTLLGTIFQQIGPPKFGMATPGGASQAAAQPGGACQGEVEIVDLGSGGVRTGVRLQNDAIVAPLAFNGTFELIPEVGPCATFTGWAEADITLHFDYEKQTLYGYVNVRTVNPDNLGPEYTPLATSLVQTAINQRVNPITILHGPQLTLALPVQAANGVLNARAKEVRSEARDGQLRLYVTYEFSGSKGLPTPTPAS